MSEKETPLSIAAQAGKTLVEFCMSEKIDNTKIEVTLNVTSGERYVLKFERVDLDNKPAKKSVKNLVSEWIALSDLVPYKPWGIPHNVYQLSERQIEKAVNYVLKMRGK